MFKTLVLAVMVMLVLFCSSAGGQTFDIVQERNGLVNVFARLQEGKPTTIAYFGGSITAGAGASDSSKTSWRALTTSWFRRQYPKTQITEVNAAIGGTGSDFGAFRLRKNVLEKKPNLIFVEFAVNDCGTAPTIVNRAVEGIVRHIRTADPTTEICFVYALAQNMLPDFKQGKLPSSVFLHDVIAAHYHISSVNVGAAAAEQINSGNLAWADFSKDVCHPTDAGYAIYADTLTSFLAQQTLHISRRALPYRLIDPLEANSWSNGDLTPLVPLTPLPRGWSIDLAKGDRELPADVSSNDPTAEPIEFRFAGDTVGICFLLGPDTGNADFKIDSGGWEPIRPFDDFSKSDVRLQSRILAEGLKPGAHTLYLRPRSDKDERSKGEYTRLAFVMTNEPPRP